MHAPHSSPWSDPSARPGDGACLVAALAYGGGVCWLAMFTALPVYLLARRRSGFVEWHAMQALTLGVGTLAVFALGIVAAMLAAAFASAGDSFAGTESSLAGLALGLPLLVVSIVSQGYAWLGMAEALCGRATPLPGVHRIADRSVDRRGGR